MENNDSRAWVQYFRRNLEEPRLPWTDLYRMSGAERVAVIGSIQQFQLGENAGGSRLLREAERFVSRSGDPDYIDALRLFVGEEQRHSRLLAKFLAVEGARCLDRHWVHGGFRWVRGLAGLEVFMRVLATAEVIAIPYYSALARATRSPLLRSICRLILREEVQHLRFQAHTFGLLSAGRAERLRRVATALHRWFLAATVVLVWIEHRPVFSAGGYSLGRLWRRSAAYFRRMCESRAVVRPLYRFPESASEKA